jgi:hypothetical protein
LERVSSGISPCNGTAREEKYLFQHLGLSGMPLLMRVLCSSGSAFWMVAMRFLTAETISSGRKAGFDCFAPLYDLVVAVF